MHSPDAPLKFEDSWMRLHLFQFVQLRPHPGGAGMLEHSPGQLFSTMPSYNASLTRSECQLLLKDVY